MLAFRILSAATIASLLLWEALKVALDCATPVGVVRSRSMAPALRRGDVVIVAGGGCGASYRKGDVVMFKVSFT